MAYAMAKKSQDYKENVSLLNLTLPNCFHSLSKLNYKNYLNYETTKTNREAIYLQLQDTFPWRDRFKSDWML